jgi:hypothetical protein
MGTRDDEYDYLFKGAVGREQTVEGATAKQRACESRSRSGRRPRLEPGG